MRATTARPHKEEVEVIEKDINMWLISLITIGRKQPKMMKGTGRIRRREEANGVR